MLLLAGTWWWWSGRQDIHFAWRVATALLILLPHAPVLAAEFLLLAAFGDHRPAPRPTPGALLRAWLGEVLWGIQTFGWRQPFRADAEPDHLPQQTSAAAPRRGLLLVHGFVCNRGLWNPWMRRLRAADVPFIAVTLEPAFGSIDDYAESIDAAVRRLQSTTGAPPLIVAHSMGGLAVRRWLQRSEAHRCCAGVVTIGSPHHGTWLARFAFSHNGRQMRRGSRWLAALADGPAAAAVPFTCYYGHCDNIVFPAATATLPGADNRHLPGLAHVHLLSSPTVFTEVMNRVRPARPGESAAVAPPRGPSPT
ncbi:esterase/lipase family protein [Pseudaquabacterium terrae]|uniref:esterase/lipase family protein n=1 Tax=Pseudaquabacterium terrae TaxID=2732868 RepID=UPI0031B5EB49